MPFRLCLTLLTYVAAAFDPTAWLDGACGRPRGRGVIVVATRFMQGQGQFPELVAARLRQLLAVAVPSVVHQTNQCFVWVLLTDPKLPAAPRRKGAHTGGPMLAYAIPGDSLAEDVLVGGSLNFLSLYSGLLGFRILLTWFPQAQGIGALRPIFNVCDVYLTLFRGIAVLGGSFDPITDGHLKCACEIVHARKAQEVWIVPCGPRPDKPSLRTSALERRAALRRSWQPWRDATRKARILGTLQYLSLIHI